MADSRRYSQAHRCSRCDINWPLARAYAETCQLCGGAVWVASELPLTLDEARQLQRDVDTARRNREAFELYYNNRSLLLCANCGGANTVVDDAYSICDTCDRPDPTNPDLLLHNMPGWDDALLPED